MKTILITGAGGFLGKYLLEALIEKGEYIIFAFGRNKATLAEKFYKKTGLRFFDTQDLENGLIPFSEIDTVIHLAFGRAYKGDSEIAKSLQFTFEIFNTIFNHKKPNIVNISSQEVYGGAYDTPRNEGSETLPISLYGLAKLSTELLLKSFNLNKEVPITNLRLPGLIGRETNTRMVNKFINNAIEGVPINIIGGSQIFSQLDVRDAANGIIALLKTPPIYWRPVYNLGFTKSYSIMEIADIVAQVAKKYNCHEVTINLNKTDDTFYAEIDSSLFYTDTNWKPLYDMEAIVESIFNCKIGNKE